jgi:leader peptidase (prepilin peptidase)/N-methyltransferase
MAAPTTRTIVRDVRSLASFAQALAWAAIVVAALLIAEATGASTREQSAWAVLVLTFGAAIIDARRMVVPNQLIVGGLAVGLGRLATLGNLASTLAAAFVVCSLLIATNALYVRARGYTALGMGDIKLIGVLAIFVQWHVVLAIYAAAVVALVVGGAGILSGRLTSTTRFPFVPFLFFGTTVVVWEFQTGQLGLWFFGTGV